MTSCQPSVFLLLPCLALALLAPLYLCYNVSIILFLFCIYVRYFSLINIFVSRTILNSQVRPQSVTVSIETVAHKLQIKLHRVGMVAQILLEELLITSTAQWRIQGGGKRVQMHSPFEGLPSRVLSKSAQT